MVSSREYKNFVGILSLERTLSGEKGVYQKTFVVPCLIGEAESVFFIIYCNFNFMAKNTYLPTYLGNCSF